MADNPMIIARRTTPEEAKAVGDNFPVMVKIGNSASYLTIEAFQNLRGQIEATAAEFANEQIARDKEEIDNNLSNLHPDG